MLRDVETGGHWGPPRFCSERKSALFIDEMPLSSNFFPRRNEFMLSTKSSPSHSSHQQYPNLTKSLQPLSHCRLVGDLSIFYRYFNGHCSQEIREIIPVPLRRVRITRSSTHSHPFQASAFQSMRFMPQIIIHP